MFEKNSLNRVVKTIFNIPENLPNYAQIEITNLCNLECPMCFKHFIDVEIKHMDFEVFKKVIDKLKGVYTITLCGYGEPLIYPRIFDAIRYCKENGFDVELTSNGLLLNKDERIKELVSSGLDSISFSFESIKEVNGIAHPNLEALSYIKELIGLRKKLNLKAPVITLQTLMIKNKERNFFDVIEWGALNGVDRINVARFEQLNTLTDVERPNIEEEKEIFKQFSYLRKKYGIRIDCLQDQVYTGAKGFLYKNFKYFLRMDEQCIRLRDFVYINVDGDVRPCCALVKSKIDSLLENDLKDIWVSKNYIHFRKNYYKVPWCSKCDFAKLKQITNDKQKRNG
jgi:MoaA/NifB/PqqE/SkfB family radical SAM enzyme